MVRYGVSPLALQGLRQPVRYGDLVVLPLDTFNAWASESGSNIPRGALVWHNGSGRWRGQYAAREEWELAEEDPWEG